MGKNVYYLKKRKQFEKEKSLFFNNYVFMSSSPRLSFFTLPPSRAVNTDSRYGNNVDF
jgi:hypothetical protein